MFAMALALALTSFVAVVPGTAVAASIYDNAYQTTDHLTVGGTVGGTTVCSDEDVTTSWQQIIADSASSASFDEALDTGSWSVSENYNYSHSASWQKIVDVFWAEDEPLQISYGYMGWGDHYSVNVSASASNKLHYGQIKANYIGASGMVNCQLYFEEFDNTVYNFQNSAISWDLPSGAPSIHNFFVANGNVTNRPSTYEGVEVRVTQPTAKYVAMGDSYSSGEGNPSFEYGTDTSSVNECHRSPKAYPRLLQDELSLDSMSFVACSGATTQNVLYGGSGIGGWNEGPQVDKLSASTEVVTITIGGNDVGFADYAYACTITLCGPTTFDYDTIMDAINDSDFFLDLSETYETILDQAPNAEVYVVNYPYLATENSDVCGTIDMTGAWAVQSQLNAVIEDAVDDVAVTTLSTKIHYVDSNQVGSPFTGKHYCNGGDSDFYGLYWPDNTEYSFHPNSSGQEHYKDIIADAIS